MKQITDLISRYRTKSAKYLLDNQIAYIPTINNDQINYLCYNYFVDGKLIRYVAQGPKCCFKLRYLKLRPKTRKNAKYFTGIHSISDLVDNKVIYPFMLFINGKFIPWELLSITTGQENYYLVVDSTDTNFSHDCIFLKYAQIVDLPDGCVYNKEYPDDRTLFSFDDHGLFNKKSKAYRIQQSKPDSNMIFTSWDTNEAVNAYPILQDVMDVKLTDKNIIIFRNGILSSSPINNIKKAHDSERVDPETGKIIPCLEFIIDDNLLPIMPSIDVTASFLTIDGGTNDKKDKLSICAFVNNDYNPSIDNISRMNHAGVSATIKKNFSEESNPSYWEDLKKDFSIEMDRDKKYDENISKAISDIYKYNPSLFNPIFMRNANVIFDNKSYKWITENTSEDGILTIPRRHSRMIDEYFLLFINGELYKYKHAGKYIASNYYLPIQGIKDGDSIELMRFQNINNVTLPITINRDDGFIERDQSIINNDMVLFSTETTDTYFKFPKDGLQHFPVDYILEKDSSGKIKITLKNEYYYGKQLTVASSNRFKHFSYYLQETPKDEVELGIDLKDKFMYCNDYSKYIVFYNGRKLNSDHYRLTLPVRSTTPFYEFKIYLTFPVLEGDHLDIVYAPAFMKDFVANYENSSEFNKNRLLTTGDIIIDKSKLTYPLSTNLFMVWINGRKIPECNIVDIDSTRMRITTDEKCIYNVCITKYAPDIDILCDVFNKTNSIWDNIISKFNDNDISNMLGIDSTIISQIEDNIYANAIDIKPIMYEIIREHYIGNDMVDITEGFIYDYQDVDTSVLEHDENGDLITDADGNTILNVLDSNSTDNLDNVERPWP